MIPKDNDLLEGVYRSSLEIKDGHKLTIAGYAATWDVYQDGTQAVKGAFAKSISILKKTQVHIPMFINHQYNVCIGVFILDKIDEDGYGLYVQGHIDTSSGIGQLAAQYVKDGILFGLSYGGVCTNYIMVNGIKVYLEMNLLEISLSEEPKCPGASITTIR